jgi:hypothetical protein
LGKGVCQSGGATARSGFDEKELVAARG